MNEVKTRVVDGTNCSKELKFGVERILSDEISSKKTGNKKHENVAFLRSFLFISNIEIDSIFKLDIALTLFDLHTWSAFK